MRTPDPSAAAARFADRTDPLGRDVIDAVALAAAPYLTRGVELDDLLGALVDAVVRGVGADRGTLYLVDGAAGVMTSIVTDVPEAVGRIVLSVGQGLAGAVAVTGSVVNVVDAQGDPRFDQRFDRATGYQTRQVLGVPVRDSRGAVIGVLQLLNSKHGAFSADDEQQATALSLQAGQVLERTSLYAALKQDRAVGKDAVGKATVGAGAARDDAQKQPGLAYRYNQIVGEGEAMQRVYALVDKAARTEATVLIQGESGTGKELIARAVHVNSGRRGMAFTKVDCTTLPEALIENELFGHDKGAFTGADKTVPGKFEVASGGTLFIDEIGELPLKLQGKLLRVLQDRQFERVGGTRTIDADIRVICATHRDLEQMVQDGTFREDLYYRIRVVPLLLPPLRDRGPADLVRLIEHFVEKYGRRHGRPDVRIADDGVERLLHHRWPGNIRELEHVIESAVVLCDDDVVHARDVPLSERSAERGSPTGVRAPSGALLVGDATLTLQQLEQEHIRLVVKACGGNQSEAARKLGIGRNTLARKLSLSGEGAPELDDEPR